MKILSVASEVYPLIKTGGLADVAGALPPALARRGIETRVLMPGYGPVMARLEGARSQVVFEYDALLGVPARLVSARLDGLDLILIDAPSLYHRSGGPYVDAAGIDHGDNWHRFGALSRAGADICAGIIEGFRPDVVHAHDWQAGLVPAYLRYSGISCPSVMTIHNIAFQGQFSAAVLGGLYLPPHAMALDGVEYHGGVGFLKAGLANASAITTVSPTYAEEIRTPAFGMGLDGLINARAPVLRGIVNGIDTGVWDPATDPILPATFSADDLEGRRANRRALEERFRLDHDDEPLFVVISRLTHQKGIDLLAETTGDLVAEGAKLAVLGTGDPALENAFAGAAARHAGRVGVVIGYDEQLAHTMQGGADGILIPSRFEPCGLTQLYGLRYGAVPIVARTGGLADTVIDANTAALNAGVATGVQFLPVDAAGLRHAIRQAVRLFRQPGTWDGLRVNGMRSDVSWDRSAALYADLYKSLIPVASGHHA
ncbi:glycogen synthase GlgA [Amaricoccus solimangrovi]|uniref:Glycogen synthase n=1 Tax=Amaricoccus solimangrovi TaxID=2589815 RepID=A0A501WR06_9RHOB|nr:glycogen synthase GlgA [Amaricoccus solimangrovi]TPE50775.1 glycogen synthase GlgA [Amaricoccus solimangrovi]